jgi:hypothetical protein
MRMTDDRMGRVAAARDHRSPDNGNAAHRLPGVFPASQEEIRPMPVRDVQAGRGGLVLLALRLARRGVHQWT